MYVYILYDVVYNIIFNFARSVLNLDIILNGETEDEIIEEETEKASTNKSKIIDQVMKFFLKTDKPNSWKCKLCQQIKPVTIYFWSFVRIKTLTIILHY